MPSLNLLLLPLISGYYFTHNCIPFQIKSERLEGHRLVFNSALWGLVFLAVSYLLCQLVYNLVPVSLYYWSKLVPYDNVGLSIISLASGVVVTHVINSFSNRDKISAEIIEKDGSELEKLFLYAAQRTKLISITMKNHKVYIGFLIKYPDPNQEPKFIRIAPQHSGYRDPVTKKFEPTTDYTIISDIDIDDLDEKDLEIVVPVEEISTANIFNVELYQEFNR